MIHYQEIEGYLTELAAVQTALQEVYQAKTEAVRQARFELFDELNLQELRLSEALAELNRHRAELLDRHAAGETLTELLRGSSHPQAVALLERTRQLQQQMKAVQQQNAMQSYLVRRWLQHYQELTGILSRRGRERTSYGPASKQQNSGGALLDTSI